MKEEQTGRPNAAAIKENVYFGWMFFGRQQQVFDLLVKMCDASTHDARIVCHSCRQRTNNVQPTVVDKHLKFALVFA